MWNDGHVAAVFGSMVMVAPFTLATHVLLQSFTFSAPEIHHGYE